MPRFFLTPERFSGERVVITGDDAHHISKVLRIKVGELITATDGEGALYQLRVTALTSEKVETMIISKRQDRAEPGVKVRLFQSVLKGEKMDWVLQKGTEIGISSFHPFISRRTVVKKDLAEFHRKNDRWSRIVLEAAKQSGRGKTPEVLLVVALEKLALYLTAPLTLVAWEEERRVSLFGLLSQTDKPQEVDLIIGPEGGFTSEEVQYLEARGARPISLGPRILRAETAGPVTAALILYHYHEMEPV